MQARKYKNLEEKIKITSSKLEQSQESLSGMHKAGFNPRHHLKASMADQGCVFQHLQGGDMIRSLDDLQLPN